MLYEIKTHEVLTVGKEYNKSFIVNNYEVVNTSKGKKVRFKQEGKKSYTYVMAERFSFHKEFETVISEATTGRVLERFN